MKHILLIGFFSCMIGGLWTSCTNYDFNAGPDLGLTFPEDTPRDTLPVPLYPYIKHNGDPYLLYGVHIRVDVLSDKTEIEEHFAKSAELGFRTVVVPVAWGNIEPQMGQYDFERVRMYYDLARKYALQIQLLWFGSNVCGTSSAPDYVNTNPALYPQHPGAVNAEWGTFLDLSVSETLSREKLALSKLLDYIAAYDTDKRTVMVQIENEPDGGGPEYDPGTNIWWTTPENVLKYCFVGGQFAAAGAAMSALGQIVHYHLPGIPTRVNLMNIQQYANMEVVKELEAHPGIDIVGIDNYAKSVAEVDPYVDCITTGRNIPHIPENSGNVRAYQAIAGRMFELGGGVIIYELKTGPKFSPDYDLGIYRLGDGWVERDGTEEIKSSGLSGSGQLENKTADIKDFNTMIYKADQQIASAGKGNIAAFNKANAGEVENEVLQVNSIPFSYSCPTGSFGLVLKVEGTNDYLLMALADNTTFGIEAFDGDSASIGSYAGTQWQEESVREVVDHTIRLNGCEVARITLE